MRNPAIHKGKRLVMTVKNPRPQQKPEGAAEARKREIKVSGTSSPKKVAGALAHIARERESVSILALSPPCLNTAVKGMAIARDYIEEDKVDAGFTIKFRKGGDPKKPKPMDINFVVFDERFEDPFGDQVIYNVKADTKSAGLAGALAARLREEGEKVHVLACVGAGCVSRALVALALLDDYVADTKLFFVPFFSKENKGETEISVVNIAIIKG